MHIIQKSIYTSLVSNTNVMFIILGLEILKFGNAKFHQIERRHRVPFVLDEHGGQSFHHLGGATDILYKFQLQKSLKMLLMGLKRDAFSVC